MLSLPEYWRQLEEERNLPGGYLSRIRQIESSGNRFAVSKTGATGPFQFTKGTARDVGLPLDQRTDEYASARAAADLAVKNRSILSKALGRDPAGGELYMAHQQGGGGAANLLMNLNAPAGSVTDPRNIAVNSGDPNAPSSEILNKFIAKYNGIKPGDNVGQGPTVANAAAQPQTPAPVAPQQPQAAIRDGGGLLGMLQSEDGITGAGLKTFLGGAEMKAGLGGLKFLAQGMGEGQKAPSAPIIQTPPPEENRPDMSLLEMLKPKNKRRIMV